MLIRITTNRILNTETMGVISYMGDTLAMREPFVIRDGDSSEQSREVFHGDMAITIWSKLCEVAGRQERIEQARDIRAQMILDEVNPLDLDDEPTVDDGDYVEHTDDTYLIPHSPY